MEIIWLTRLVLAHLLTDFFLQPKHWIADRKKNKFRSGSLYLHSFLTAALAWVMIGWQYWLVALVILITHTLIDGWKSFMNDSARYFVADQFLHLSVILICWVVTFYDMSDVALIWNRILANANLWTMITAFTFLSLPCSFLIGQVTKKWRAQLPDADALENAGKWIGILERSLVLLLILRNQYEAIGLLIAAKGLIRFSDRERTEQKTEYLLIGTLVSISLTIITGITVLALVK